MAWNWVTEGIKTDPDANVVLADTLPLSGGERIFLIVIWDDLAGFESVLQWRDADNLNNKKSQVLSIPVSLSSKLIVRFKPLLNERVRVINRTAITGNVQVSIFYS